MMNLTDEKFWVNYWDSSNFDPEKMLLGDNNIIKRWLISTKLKIAKNSVCLEIGCFPGQFLTIFGEMGCILNGIDLVDEVETETPKNLIRLGFTIGDFTKVDFFEYSKAKPNFFDVVCSFGFLEHFTNWEEVLRLQSELVKPGGYLIMETPNFKSFPQYLIRFLLDKKSLKFHNLDSMNPHKWRLLMENWGFDVDFCGGIGKISEWSVANPKMTKLQIFIRGQLRHRITPFLAKLLPADNRMFSPYYGLIARKTQF
jgi:SAM-dependent methyltransferase